MLAAKRDRRDVRRDDDAIAERYQTATPAVIRSNQIDGIEIEPDGILVFGEWVGKKINGLP
ncbi:hypothetical protein [Planococcus sp. MB-3u-03]|uniref:hypothetical protein n=1 Tax=Planococcus sp. MB-3u-03 TaxID=2058136 RepID=UPI001E476EE2|nr:hypothetical protein [Planococcus sp. MB-3u-03]